MNCLQYLQCHYSCWLTAPFASPVPRVTLVGCDDTIALPFSGDSKLVNTPFTAAVTSLPYEQLHAQADEYIK